ncbi:MAG: hypothetical protein RLO50_11020 [Azospirillaceae bacterium]
MTTGIRKHSLLALTAASIVALSAPLAAELTIGGNALAQGGPPGDVGGGPPDGAGGGPGGGGPGGGGPGGDGPGGGPPDGVGGGPPDGVGGGPPDGVGGGPPAWAGGGSGQENAAAAQAVRDTFGGGPGNGFGPGGVGNEVLVLSDEETRQLIANGWGANVPSDGVFANHGQRVRTMVAIAQALGYSSHVGALQANFGTSHETGLADLQAEIEALAGQSPLGPDDDDFPPEVETALADAADLLSQEPDLSDPDSVRAAFDEALAAVEPGSALETQLLEAQQAYEEALEQATSDQQEELGELQTQLEGLAESVKPGDGPDDGWELVDLDVNGDGVVDGADLTAIDDQ